MSATKVRTETVFVFVLHNCLEGLDGLMWLGLTPLDGAEPMTLARDGLTPLEGAESMTLVRDGLAPRVTPDDLFGEDEDINPPFFSSEVETRFDVLLRFGVIIFFVLSSARSMLLFRRLELDVLLGHRC
ncbi:hypothetical protein HanXRQr2_Chr05g0203291 [Helianthus annuus]|uniref:Uncharacterized protein n=1 Tax=Helianthus annuus TaxID=4232 RepID=A0A9K3IYE6_HELAN|nr:hypothetical protein HanXRQr2_Chr05g0203291 [Helianthus annuus]KAJ0746845.1 hypothetical protein HanOQP8_Chr05g0182591 [Helianthus annuus]KAJ0921821.1 hypothetical protein HanPSC8_Chr05g0196131 [Helianthus annuus]